MKRIASFCVDHTKLMPGIYLSRVDGDVTTYDLRFCKPNCPPFLEYAAIHTIEHLFATIARNSRYTDQIIYFGPMGCRTGFYFLTRGMEHSQVIALIKKIIRQIAEYEGKIPGTSAAECGNYLEHDLEGARKAAGQYAKAIENWTEEQLSYLP